MKSVTVAALLGGASLFATGCSHSNSNLEDSLLSPPAYSASENFHRQLRYAGYDWHQAIDDFDTNVVMTRPGSAMTHWNLVHSD